MRAPSSPRRRPTVLAARRFSRSDGVLVFRHAQVLLGFRSMPHFFIRFLTAASLTPYLTAIRVAGCVSKCVSKSCLVIWLQGLSVCRRWRGVSSPSDRSLRFPRCSAPLLQAHQAFFRDTGLDCSASLAVNVRLYGRSPDQCRSRQSRILRQMLKKSVANHGPSRRRGPSFPECVSRPETLRLRKQEPFCPSVPEKPNRCRVQYQRLVGEA